MNPAASPVRTWTILINQCGLPSVAGAITAAFLCGGDRLPRLAGMGGAEQSAFQANAQRQGDSHFEPFAECAGDRHLGGPADSIPVRSGGRPADTRVLFQSARSQGIYRNAVKQPVFSPLRLMECRVLNRPRGCLEHQRIGLTNMHGFDPRTRLPPVLEVHSAAYSRRCASDIPIGRGTQEHN